MDLGSQIKNDQNKTNTEIRKKMAEGIDQKIADEKAKARLPSPELISAIEGLRNMPERVKDQRLFKFDGYNSMPMPSDNKDICFLIELVHKILGKPYGWE